MSSALFGNAAFSEVVTAAHTIMGANGAVTTRQVAAATGRSDSVVRPVMLRLVEAGLLMEPEVAQSRGPKPYLRVSPALWRDLLVAIGAATGEPIDLLHLADQ